MTTMTRKYDWGIMCNDDGKWDWCIWHNTAPYYEAVSEGWENPEAAYNDMLRFALEHGIAITH